MSIPPSSYKDFHSIVKEDSAICFGTCNAKTIPKSNKKKLKKKGQEDVIIGKINIDNINQSEFTKLHV